MNAARPAPDSGVDPDWAWWERGLMAVFGAALLAPIVWATGLTWFIAVHLLDCDGPNDPSDVLLGALAGGAWAALYVAGWLAVGSLVLAVSGRRGLRWRTWVAVMASCAGLVGVGTAVALAVQPPPSETCQPFVWN